MIVTMHSIISTTPNSYALNILVSKVFLVLFFFFYQEDNSASEELGNKFNKQFQV